MCTRVCVCACVRARTRACEPCLCVRVCACVHVYVHCAKDAKLKNIVCVIPFQEDSADEILYHGKLSIGLKFAPQHENRGEQKHQTLGTLHVAIKQARELLVMDAHGLTDATVKCFLLPNRSSAGKRKTRVVKNSLNPVWEEEFTYKNVTLEELSKERVLEVTVWDYDRRGSNDFIGGLHLGPTPGSAAKHREWMDCIGDEISHWEAVLAHPGEWVEQWHTLRPSMDPMANKRAPPTKELSPVQELSPTQEDELSHPAEQLPTLEAYSFTPPITPSPAPAEDASPPGGIKPVASVSPCVCVCVCVGVWVVRGGGNIVSSFKGGIYNL